MTDADSHTYDGPIVYADERPDLASPGRASRRHRLGSGLRPPSRPPRTLAFRGWWAVLAGVALMFLALLAVGGVVPTPGAYSPPSEYSDVVKSHPWVVTLAVCGAIVTVFVLFVSALVALPAPKAKRGSRGEGSA